MAQFVFRATQDASGAALGDQADPLAALVAAMAVLVADGASPTEAHVTTADAALTALLALTGISLTVDTATVTTITKLRRHLEAALLAAQSSGRFTP